MEFFGFVVSDIVAEFLLWLIDPPNEKGLKRLTTILKRVLVIAAIIAAVASVIILIVWVTSYFGDIPTSTPSYAHSK